MHFYGFGRKKYEITLKKITIQRPKNCDEESELLNVFEVLKIKNLISPNIDWKVEKIS